MRTSFCKFRDQSFWTRSFFFLIIFVIGHPLSHFWPETNKTCYSGCEKTTQKNFGDFTKSLKIDQHSEEHTFAAGKQKGLRSCSSFDAEYVVFEVPNKLLPASGFCS